MKDPQKQRIKELEKKLKAAELKVYDKLIEVTNREWNTDIVKKFEAKLSESWQQKMNWVLLLYVVNLAIVNKLTINRKRINKRSIVMLQ